MAPTDLFLFLTLISLSAFFSGSEIALMSIASHKIETLYREGRYGSKSLKKIKQHNDKLLITLLIGNNTVNTYTAALATSIAISLSGDLGFEKSVVIGAATGIVTIVLLLFGEIVPKSLASKNATKVALFVAPIYKVLMFLLYPLIIIIELVVKIFSRKKFAEKITGEELEVFIDLGKDSGTIESSEHEKIKNILEFGDVTAEQIMTPRVNIDAIDSQRTVSEARKFYLEHTHSRIPVYTNVIDKIDYFLTIRDLFGEEDNKKLCDLKLNETIKVPINQPIDKLFEIFQKAHKHIAIVIDEYGGVAGLITLEDIIEEIFGEIRDETDKEIDKLKKMGDDHFVIDSSLLMEDVLKKFSLELEDIGLNEDEFAGETVSYILTYKIEGFPSVGEIIKFAISSDFEHKKEQHNEDEKNDKDKKEHKNDKNKELKEENYSNRNLEFHILDITDSKIGKIEVKLV